MQKPNHQTLIPGLGLAVSQSASASSSAGITDGPLSATYTEGSSGTAGLTNRAPGWYQTEPSHTNLSYTEFENRKGLYSNASTSHHQEVSFGGDDSSRGSPYVANSQVDISSRQPPLPPLPPPRMPPPVHHEGQSVHFVEGSNFRQGYPAAPPLPPGPRPKDMRVEEVQNEWIDPTKHTADVPKELTSRSEPLDRRPRRREAEALDSDKKATMSPYLSKWDGSKMDVDGQFYEAYCDRDIDKAMFSIRAAFLKKNITTAKSSITKKQTRSGPMKISLKKPKKKT